MKLELDILGQVKYTVIYEGYCVTVFTLLLASLDFRETRNMRLTSSSFRDTLKLHTEGCLG